MASPYLHCRLPEALKDFEQALTVEPNSALSHNARGLLLEKMGRPDAALADFEAAVQIDRGVNADFLRNRGLCCRALKDYNKAVQDFDRCTCMTHTLDCSVGLLQFRTHCCSWLAALQ